jgi:hypothetical protein
MSRILIRFNQLGIYGEKIVKSTDCLLENPPN